jgi:Fe-Mn family superoxide dismutase
MAIELDPLPYAEDALEPYISKETLSFHYGKHHAGYVKKLNELLLKAPVQGNTLETFLNPEVYEKHRPIFNNAAQIWNHTFYWNSMRSAKSPEAIPEQFEEEIKKAFGSVQFFKEKFATVAASHFGSGWVWLVKTAHNNLEIMDTHDAYNPLVEGKVTPLLVLDVWEHAYYIDKRNNRPAYIEDWLKMINWDFAFRNWQKSKL